MHTTMALLMEEKEKILDLLSELAVHVGLREKNEFDTVQRITGEQFTDKDIRQARLRDIQRDDLTPHIEDRKDKILKELFILCPLMQRFIKRIDYTYWDSNHIVRAMPEDIMISSDWEDFYALVEELMT